MTAKKTAAPSVRVRGLRTIRAEETGALATYLVKVFRLAALPAEGQTICVNESTGRWANHVIERVDLIELLDVDGEASPAWQLVFALEDYTAERGATKIVLGLAEGAGWTRIVR